MSALQRGGIDGYAISYACVKQIIIIIAFPGWFQTKNIFQSKIK